MIFSRFGRALPLARTATRIYARSSSDAAEFEKRMLDTFRNTEELEQVQALVNRVCQEYIEADHVTTPNVTEEDLASRFRQKDMPHEPVKVSTYFDDLVKNVVLDGVHTSCPQMIGHMTSALPTHIPLLAKLNAA
jgi:glutamate decarboxylase